MNRVALAVVLLALVGVTGCGDEAAHPPEPTYAPLPPPLDWARVSAEQVAEAKKHGVPVAFENELGMRFVLIPAGTFAMGLPEDEEGRDDDETQRQVTITKPFYMQITEVTNAQYAAFLKESGYDGATAHPSSREPYLGTWMDGTFREGRGQYPICGVNWHHACAYCRWVGEKTGRRVRLPTEAEWEYVARGEEGRTYPWGEAWNPTACNWGDEGKVDGFDGASPVRSFASGATRQGVYDLAGNVWEWCADAVRGVRDDIGTGTGDDADLRRTRHPLRGGPWCLGAEDLRSGGRWYASPNIADDKIGFRLLVEIVRPPAK